MITKILPATSSKAIKLACHLLREGEVVAFPTDTVYGVGVNAYESVAVHKLFAIKERPLDKGLPVFIYQVDDLHLVARNVPDGAWPLLQNLWPGALTVILSKNPALSDDLTGGHETVAIRIPEHPISLDLVNQVGRPLAVTSANLSGQPTPHTAQGVATQLGGRIPLILDGGPSPSSQPSSIIDLSTDPPQLLRKGILEMELLRKFLPDLKDNDHRP